jgi:NitT/TauT family transport system substrate-binding protein
VETGLLVKQLAVVLDRSADAIFYLKGIGIDKPQGLAGKSLGAAVGETPLNLFPVFAGNAGLDPSKVKIVNLTPPAKFPTLVSKRCHRSDAHGRACHSECSTEG